MRVLLTGATGFLGSHLARAFVARGDEVHAIRRSSSSHARLGATADVIQWHKVSDEVEDIVQAVRPDVLLHAATAYGRKGDQPEAIERVNLDWPRSLLSAATNAKVTLFVNIDTSLPPALSEYARTKRAFAELARESVESAKSAEPAKSADLGATRVLNVRLESVFGAGDDPAKFQMTLLHALLRGDATFPLTPGEQARDYIYIYDAVAAILLLVDHARRTSDPYLAAGVGTGRALRIREFAETLKRLIGAPTRLAFGALPYRDGELMEAKADISLLTALGWPGARSLDDGLRTMIAEERDPI